MPLYELPLILALLSNAQPTTPPTPPAKVCKVEKQPVDSQGKPIWNYIVDSNCKVIPLDNISSSTRINLKSEAKPNRNNRKTESCTDLRGCGRGNRT